MELNNIKPTDNWGTTASNINSNFQKTSVEVEKIRYLTSRSKGLYNTDDALRSAIPTPRDGDWAIVGTTIPGPIWAASDGVWSATGKTGGVGNVELAGYATTQELNVVKETVNAAKEEAAAAKTSANKAMEGLEEALKESSSAAGQAKDALDLAESADEKATDAVDIAQSVQDSLNKTLPLINVNNLCSDVIYTLSSAIAAVATIESYKKSGLVMTYRTNKGFETKQFVGSTVDWSDEELWKDFGGGGSGSGAINVFNVTELVPLELGYYTLATAIVAIPEEFRHKGLVVTFESAQGKWLSYQFIGTSLESFTTMSSWDEFGGAGTVKQITLNGQQQTSDESGNITLVIDQMQIDDTLTPTGTNPVQGKAIHAAIEGIETGAALLLNTLGEGDDKAYSLSLLDKNGEVLSTTETFTGGGGGGSVATTKIVLTRITDNPTIKVGDEVKLQFMYDQIDTTSGSSTGNPGQAVITVLRGATSSTIKQLLTAGSTTTLDVSKYIGVGNNTVRVRVTVGEGAEQQVSSIAWSVNAVELKLTSSFNIATIINRGDQVFIPFALQGSGSKTLRLYINGVDTEDRTIGTSSSNGSFTVATSTLSHGAHSVQLMAELELGDGKKILSNSIYFDIAVRESGKQNPIIATRFDYPDGSIIATGSRPYISVRQYDNYTLTYAAYNPKEIPTKVDIYEAGILVSSSMVLFVRNTLKLRAMNSGDMSCQMKCGSLQYPYGLDVSKSDLNLTEPTDNMILKLSATGRTNSDINRAEWTYKNITTKLKNFMFGGDGWIENALRLRGSARATVQLMPLQAPEQNVTNAFSFSIRLQVSDVMDEEAEVVRCMDENGTGFVITTQEARMVTRGNSQVAMKFATAEVYNIGFVSHPTSSSDSTDYGKTNDSMMYLYINGIMSGGVQRGKSDSIYQDTPGFIAIGSSECTTDVYGIRAYSVALTDAQMLDAYIVDLNTADDLINTYNKNNVLDDNGQITVDSLPDDMPYMIVTGVQPNGIPTLIHAAVMNNKKTKFNVDQILFVWKSKAYQNFVCSDSCISLQGTSSLAYPIKNYRFYLKDSNKVPGTMYLACDTQGIGGTLQEKPLYSLTMEEQGVGKISVPVDCFCGKADYAESSSSHNTGMAKLVNDVLNSCAILTPAQRYVDRNKYSYDVRTTVDGHPMMLFYRNTVNDTPVFAGKFNLNNDKSTEDVFGFKGIPGYHDAGWVQEKFGGKNPTECWEFLNNDYPMGMFLDDDFDSKDEEGVPNWLKVFEARFPDDDDINAEYEAGTRKPENLMKLVKWIKSTKGNGAKFKAEVANYFDVEFLCAYYMFTEMMGCVDQRVKNMMFGFWYDPVSGKVLCYPIFYDCDTILGVRNDGRLKYNPFINHNSIDPELTTAQKTVYAYAGHDSVLWENLREQCKTELDAVYKKMRAKMANDTIFNMFDTEQSGKFCERVYNLDALYKYVSPKTNGVDVINNGQVTTLTYSYMEAMQGSRVSHRHWWVNNRMSLFDARYMTGQYLSTDLTFKGNSAAGAVIRATSIRDFYFALSREGSVMTHVAVSSEQEWIYTYGNMANIGTIFHFYGGEYVRKLNLSLWGGFTDINLPYMPKLQELTLGVDGYEYQLSELTIGTKLPMMTHLLMRNYTKIASVDLSHCILLQVFDGKGCMSMSVVNFAEGAPLTSIYYPVNYQTIKLLYLPNITRSGIVLERKQSVTTLWVENCANLNAMELFDELFSLSNRALRQVRITGLNLTGDGSDLKRWYDAGLGGIDSMGNTIANKCKMCGTYQLTNFLDDAVMAQYVKRFDELNILLPAYTIIEFNTTVADDANITNLDNRTGYDYGVGYVSSGHINKILGMRHRVLGKKTAEGELTVCLLDDNNSTFYSDGQPAVLTGEEGDVFVYEPKYWYKGVNDWLNKKQYHLYSTNEEPPVSNAVKVLQASIETQVPEAGLRLLINLATIEEAAEVNIKMSYYIHPISGYKRVRVPLTLDASYGAMFIDDDNRIISRLKPSNSSGFQDGDYIFADIPPLATKIAFTVNADFDYMLLIGSTDIADAEPDWVRHEECLNGVFKSCMLDTSTQNNVSRSISGVFASLDIRKNDLDIYLQQMGEGYWMCSYEERKMITNLFLAKYGRRNSQVVFGFGGSANAASGNTSTIGMNDTDSDGKTAGGYFGGANIGAVNSLGYENLYCLVSEYFHCKVMKNLLLGIFSKQEVIRTMQASYTYMSYMSIMRNGRCMDIIGCRFEGSSSTFYCDNATYTSVLGNPWYSIGGYASNSGIFSIGGSTGNESNPTGISHRLSFDGRILFEPNSSNYKNL